MNTLIFKTSAIRVWFDSKDMWPILADGRQLSVTLVYFPRLLNASSEQRQGYKMSSGGTGLHWEEIDEALSVRGLLLGYSDLRNSKNQQKPS